MKFVFACLLSLSAIVQVSAQYHYDMNSNCRKAYQQILNLRFEDARVTIQGEANDNPNNLIIPYLEHYMLFLENVISGDKTLFSRSGATHTRLMDRVDAGNRASPWHLYSKAQMSLQWALVRIREGNYAGAALDFNRAYRLLNQNNELYPDFIPGHTGIALMQILIGAIPENYQWVTRLFSLKGSVNEGINRLQQISANATDVFLQQESLFLLTFTTFNLGDNEHHTRFLESILTQPEIMKLVSRSPLLIYSSVVFNMHNGQNERALNLLLQCPRGKGYYPFYYLDYLTGVAKLNRLDKDASVWFLRYLVNYKGEAFVKSAYQRLAWAALIEGDTRKHADYMHSVKVRGNTQLEGDQRAQQQAETGQIPDVGLLKAALLFDGGYYERAMNELDKIKATDLTSKREQLEFIYRKARIYHEWGKPFSAIQAYQQTLQQGRDHPWYFAANAALNLGIIFENQKQYAEAARYFRICLSLDYSEYKTSISQKARAGLNRVSHLKE
ncbi:hypothetical protein MASR1M74_24480 [Lentimicrobium sp.]